MKKVLVLQGPNMNRLGKRQPEIYGYNTLADVNADLAIHASELGLTVEDFQSNHEGELIDWLQERQEEADAVIVNPAGIVNYGLALRDAIAESESLVGVVHVTALHKREKWRHNDVFADIADVYVCGMGYRGYGYTLRGLYYKWSDAQK